jgi:hypothetical protein
MMARLGALLRFSLEHAGRQEVTLAEESRFLEDYLAIERMRFEDRLTVDVRIEDSVGESLVPKTTGSACPRAGAWRITPVSACPISCIVSTNCTDRSTASK